MNIHTRNEHSHKYHYVHPRAYCKHTELEMYFTINVFHELPTIMKTSKTQEGVYETFYHVYDMHTTTQTGYTTKK